MRKEKKIDAEKKDGGKKKRGGKKKIVIRVLLVIAAVILLVTIGLFISCRTSFTEPGITQADIQPVGVAGQAGGVLGAQEALRENGDGIYQSLHGFTWEQSVEDFSDDKPASYTGTDTAQIHSTYCTPVCHADLPEFSAELESYRSDAAEARRMIQRMVDDYNCPLTEEQIEALVSAYTKNGTP
jgi:uncharacterized protein YneF (UPF0154 family)